jgi:hypothetical protein
MLQLHWRTCNSNVWRKIAKVEKLAILGNRSPARKKRRRWMRASSSKYRLNNLQINCRTYKNVTFQFMRGKRKLNRSLKHYVLHDVCECNFFVIFDSNFFPLSQPCAFISTVAEKQPRACPPNPGERKKERKKDDTAESL